MSKKRILKNTCLYIAYSGVAFFISQIIDFLMRFFVPYFFYKEEVISAITSIINVIIFLLFFGLNQIENMGYFDKLDNICGIKTYAKTMFYTSLLIMIFPLFVCIKKDAVGTYIWSVFFSTISPLVQPINDALYITDIIQPLPMFLGTFIMVILIDFLLYPFYKLGIHNRIRETEDMS